jgi:hypothetical protein
MKSGSQVGAGDGAGRSRAGATPSCEADEAGRHRVAAGRDMPAASNLGPEQWGTVIPAPHLHSLAAHTLLQSPPRTCSADRVLHHKSCRQAQEAGMRLCCIVQSGSPADCCLGLPQIAQVDPRPKCGSSFMHRGSLHSRLSGTRSAGCTSGICTPLSWSSTLSWLQLLSTQGCTVHCKPCRGGAGQDDAAP